MGPIRFSCQNCHQTIKAAHHHAGRKARCPSCKKAVTVPAETQVRPQSDEFSLAAMSLGDDINIEDFDSDVSSASSPKRDRVLLTDAGVEYAAAGNPTERSDAAYGRVSVADDGHAYPVLLRVGVTFRILAGAVVIVWVLLLASTVLGLDTPAANSPPVAGQVSPPPQPTSILSFTFAYRALGGAIIVCGLIAASELIKVIVQIQENTAARYRR